MEQPTKKKAGAVSKADQKAATATASSLNRRAVRAIVIPMKKDLVTLKKQLDAEQDDASKSKELPEDPFETLAAEGRVIEPPFDLLTLAMLSEHNTELGQCIEAMVFNIEGFGHRFVSRVKVAKDDRKLADEVADERLKLENFFMYCCGDDSFTAWREKLRSDLEHTGVAWAEVLRNKGNDIVGFNHIPSYQMRLGMLDKDTIKVDQPVLSVKKGGEVVVKKQSVWRRFRMHVQSKAIFTRRLTTVGSAEMRWFKSFGDPRHYDCTTGEPETEEKKVEEEKRANEVIYFRLYSPRSPYGLPRFIGNLLSIFGDRKSEEINYITFLNHNIPSMAVVVSNGQITEGTIKRIEDFVESQIQGSDNYSKFLILEAEPSEMDTGEDAGHVKISIQPLTRDQITDALFQNYSTNNQDKVRRAFRLPPIFVGKADDYTRATAESSRRLADEQIFAPERDEFDQWMNRIIFPVMDVRFHRFKSNSPNTTDNPELVKMLAAAEKTGALTPRIGRLIMSDVLSQDLPDFPDEFPADVPFSMTMAEAVKNKADPAEPGAQLTALKNMELIEKLTGTRESEAILSSMDREEEMMSTLLRLQKRIDDKWSKEAEASTEPHLHPEDEGAE